MCIIHIFRQIVTPITQARVFLYNMNQKYIVKYDMNVIKRDGTPQEYSFLKIVDTVNKEGESVNQDVPDKSSAQRQE